MRYVCLLILLTLYIGGCTSSELASTETLPPGDARQGEALFTQNIGGAPACSTCHTLDGAALVGPSFQGYGSRAAARVANTSAETYTYESITRPAVHLVEGFPNAMYGQYAQALSPQQFADLIAYLLTL
jgi:mono/diheme cytochrome c family protein